MNELISDNFWFILCIIAALILIISAEWCYRKAQQRKAIASLKVKEERQTRVVDLGDGDLDRPAE